MYWNLLKKGCCPKCKYPLKDNALLIVCKNCSFKIRPEKLREIVESQTDEKKKKKAPKTEEDQLAELNALGMTPQENNEEIPDDLFPF